MESAGLTEVAVTGVGCAGLGKFADPNVEVADDKFGERGGEFAKKADGFEPRGCWK